MTDKTESSRDASRRTVLGAGAALLGAVSGGMTTPARAELAELLLPGRAPDTLPPGYNILFVLVDQEHHFEKWPFPVPGRGVPEKIRHHLP
jgi:hypothetical protein